MRTVINMLDYEFQTWKVISKLTKKSKSNNAFWTCECQVCHKIKDFCGTEIRLNRTGACNHKDLKKNSSKINNKIKNEINNRYGKLKVISFAYTKNSFAYWNCKCDCGTEMIVRGNSLRTGAVQSCGCQKSWKEEEIRKILEQNNIIFKREFTFNDLKDKNLLRFDFAIFSSNKLIGLIEYQGSQHYENPSVFNNNGKLQLHDQMKKDYCEKNKIPLLELNKDSDLKKEILFFINLFNPD